MLSANTTGGSNLFSGLNTTKGMLTSGQISSNGNKITVNHIKTMHRPTKDNKMDDRNIFYKMEGEQQQQNNSGLHNSMAMTDTQLTAKDLNSANMRRNGTSHGNRRTTNFFTSNNNNNQNNE